MWQSFWLKYQKFNYLMMICLYGLHFMSCLLVADTWVIIWTLQNYRWTCMDNHWMQNFENFNSINIFYMDIIELCKCFELYMLIINFCVWCNCINCENIVDLCIVVCPCDVACVVICFINVSCYFCQSINKIRLHLLQDIYINKTRNSTYCLIFHHSSSEFFDKYIELF